MLPLLFVVVFAALTAAVSAFGWRYYIRPARILERVAPCEHPAPNVAAGGGGRRVTEALQWVGEQLPKSPSEMPANLRALTVAGFRSDGALAIYMGVRAVAAVALAGLSYLVFAGAGLHPVLVAMAAGLGGFVGYLGPSLGLEEIAKARRQRLRLALPDALDLIVVCVEAGVGLDQAVATVSQELAVAHPDLTQELSLVAIEMRAGVNRSAALKNFAERTGESEVKKLVTVLVQTDKFGTSLADSLRGHANFMRAMRRHAAEERAGKVAVKLTIPTFLFIMPSILVVAAGPAILRLVKELLPAIRHAGAS